MDGALAMMASHAPLLAIVVPLLAAPLAVLFSNRTVAFVISWLSCLVSFALSAYLALLVSDGAVLSYAIGGWAPPLGIEYRVDAANAFVMVIVSAIALVVFPYARTSIEREIAQSSHTLFYACMMLCFTGLMGVTVTGDAFNVFVFLEISSLSTYVLVALGASKDRRALSAAYDYLVLGTIGATFFVIGLGLIYMVTGTLNLVDLSQRLEGLDDNRTVRTAFAFIVIGLGLKIAIYPLHRWLPGAYTYAPSAVSAFLAATATKVAIYALLRFVFSVFSPDVGFERDTLHFIVMPLAIVAMFAGSLVATFQTNVKRLLAYSSIAQVGYMLLGTTMLTATGLTGSIVHLFNHAVTKGALFLAVGAVIYRLGSASLPAFYGLGRQMPWTAAAITAGGMSLIGAPGTVGFVSKWVLMQAAFEADLWPIAFLIGVSSLIAIAYVWKLVEAMYLTAAPEGAVRQEAPWSMLIPIWILTLISIGFGFDAEYTVGMARTAAESLLSGAFTADGAIILGTPGRP